MQAVTLQEEQVAATADVVAAVAIDRIDDHNAAEVGAECFALEKRAVPVLIPQP